MNIREALQKEHSREQALRIARYACRSPDHFAALMECFTCNDYRTAQRAAWSVSWAARTKPEMVAPYLPVLVDQLYRDDVHVAVKRNAVRVLEVVDVPEALHGRLMNACFGFIEDPSCAAAIKAFSLTILFRLSSVYPELKPELKLLIETQWEHETPAFHSRGRKILQALSRR